MNVSTYFSDISQQFIQVPPSSYPGVLWDFYIQYLCSYQPNSWVGRIASTCRVLAILVSLPIIILGLLDIASYGIARTLGIIDDVEASTSDTTTNASIPSIHVAPSTSSLSCTDSEPESSRASRNKRLSNDVYQTLSQEESLSMLGASQPRAFFASDEGSDFKLSGVGVFSPATSRPSSPVLNRKFVVEGGKTVGQEQDIGLRQRIGRDADITE